MPYVESWDEFYRGAEALYRAAPLRVRGVRGPTGRSQRCTREVLGLRHRGSQARFCTKYRHTDGALVLKVTDDVQVRPTCTAHAAAQRSALITALALCAAPVPQVQD
jgi:hypothetical protein